MDSQELFHRAAWFHQRGDLALAERLYLQALQVEPANFAACHLLGVLRSQQGRNAEALELIVAALKIHSDAVVLSNYGNVLNALGRVEEALASYEKALAIRPDYTEALNNRGATLSGMKRFEEALASYDKALAIKPNHAEALNNRGIALRGLNRFEEALASHDKALALKPDFIDALVSRGNILRDLKRFEEALASYDGTLAIKPDHAEALNSRGIVLRSLKHFADALASYDKALAITPDYAEALYNRGNVLQDLERLAEAMASYDKALAVRPDFADALKNLGYVLCEVHRTADGLAALTRHAALVYGTPANRPLDEPALPHKARHDREQRDYLAGGNASDENPVIEDMFRLEQAERLATPAVNPCNAADIAGQWRTRKPQIVVIDNLLTDEALEKLRRFCWGSTMWRRSYDDGYLGAMPEYGFACPLLAQIADELRTTFPAIFGAHPLLYFWGFKYDSKLTGIRIHADFAAVNVNFWITPDEANLDPASGGLVIWDVAAPPDWDFAKYNTDVAASRAFLARAGAKPVTVPYRANRAVIFDSDIFHETDKIAFKDGYLNRRINITLLYGRRNSGNGNIG